MVYPALRQAVPGFLFHIGICATMGVDPRQPGLFVGPHFEEVLSGVDLSGFRARLTDEGALALFDYWRSEEHTSELQSLMRNSYAVFCLRQKKTNSPTDKRMSTNRTS